VAIPSETLATVQPVGSDAFAGHDSADVRLSGVEAGQAVKDALAIVPMIVTSIELWKTERLVPLERNPRTHSDEQIGARDKRGTRACGSTDAFSVAADRSTSRSRLPGSSPRSPGARRSPHHHARAATAVSGSEPPARTARSDTPD